jgi:hypothetical protein
MRSLGRKASLGMTRQENALPFCPQKALSPGVRGVKLDIKIRFWLFGKVPSHVVPANRRICTENGRFPRV